VDPSKKWAGKVWQYDERNMGLGQNLLIMMVNGTACTHRNGYGSISIDTFLVG